MHGRIIQLADASTPKDFWKGGTDYYACIMGNIVDYVCEDEYREDTINWLKEHLQTTTQDKVKFFWNSDHDDGVGFIFKEGFREARFAERLEKFKTALVDLANKVTIDRFSTQDIDVWMSFLNGIYEDKYCFYIDTDDCGLETLDSFIRHAKEDKPYYICATFNYHIAEGD